jgi:hypothetical protein
MFPPSKLSVKVNGLGKKADRQDDAYALLRTQVIDLSRELNSLRGVVQEFLQSPSTTSIELSHVDASNIKVEHKLVEVVQAMADHLRLGSVPEASAEIVVISPE